MSGSHRCPVQQLVVPVLRNSWFLRVDDLTASYTLDRRLLTFLNKRFSTDVGWRREGLPLFEAAERLVGVGEFRIRRGTRRAASAGSTGNSLRARAGGVNVGRCTNRSITREVTGLS